MDVILKISRFNPEKDPLPHSQEFVVSVLPNQTVLDALLLAWEQDPGLSFRRSCRSGICGSCAVMINGRPALACQTVIGVASPGGDEVRLDPLRHFRQIKDLVVDLDPLFDSLKVALPWLVMKETYDGRMDSKAVQKICTPATCILCGICHGDLGAEDARPAAVVKALRLAGDPRDALGIHRIRLLQLPAEVLRLFIQKLPQSCPKRIEMDLEILEAATNSDSGI